MDMNKNECQQGFLVLYFRNPGYFLVIYFIRTVYVHRNLCVALVNCVGDLWEPIGIRSCLVLVCGFLFSKPRHLNTIGFYT